MKLYYNLNERRNLYIATNGCWPLLPLPSKAFLFEPWHIFHQLELGPNYEVSSPGVHEAVDGG